jgi:hypothetical protein
MRRLSVLVLILLLPGLLSVIVVRRAAIAPVYQLTFDSSEGGSDCAEHDADSTNNSYWECAYAGGTCEPQQGDGAMRHNGGGSMTFTQWCDVIDIPLDVFWVRFWYYVDENILNPVSYTLSFRKNGENCDNIGSGYHIILWTPINNELILQCEGVTTVATPDGYIDQTEMDLLFKVDLVAGTIEMWQDDFTGPADWSCDGPGGDSGFDGFRMSARSRTDEQCWDDIRVYDADPR